MDRMDGMDNARGAGYGQRETAEADALTVREFSLRAETVDVGARTVEAVLATEGVAQVLDFSRFEVVDEVLRMDGVAAPAQLVLLESHRRSVDTIVGSVRQIRVEGDRLVGRLHFARDNARAEQVWGLVRDGHLTDVSVGYRVDASELVPANTERKVGGRVHRAGDRPLRVTTGWTPREVSVVAIGADEAAKVRAARAREEVEAMKVLRKYLEKLGLRAGADDQELHRFWAQLEGEERAEADRLAAEEGVELQVELRGARSASGSAGGSEAARTDPERRGELGAVGGDAGHAGQAGHAGHAGRVAPPAADVDRAVAEALERERRRVGDIERAGAGLPRPLIEQAIREGWQAEQYNRAFLEAFRQQRDEPVAPGFVGRARQEPGAFARSLTAAIMLRAGRGVAQIPVGRGVVDPDEQRRMRERAANEAEPFIDASLLDITREFLRHENIVVHGRREQIRAAVSSAAFGSIFTDSVNAFVSQAYEAWPDSSRAWVESGEANDFKTHTDITLGRSSGLDRVPRGGEAPHATMDDAAETFKVARYGEQFVIDEQDIIDDRFDALMEVPALMGEEAAQLQPDLVYSILLANPTLNADSVALFDNGHSNTASNALDETNLQAGITAMAKQTHGDRILNLRPRFLIVPQDLNFTAKKLISSAEILQSTGNTTPVVFGTRNVLLDENLQLVVENRLGAGGVTDPYTGTAHTGSATTWFLAAARRTIRVMYLRGSNRAPMVRSFTLDRGRWGIGWDIKHDIGAYARDYRGLYRGNT